MPATIPSLTCQPTVRRVGLGTFLSGRDQDGGSAGAGHPHGIVTVWPRGEGTAAAVGEIKAVELFAKLGHSMAMVLAMG